MLLSKRGPSRAAQLEHLPYCGLEGPISSAEATTLIPSSDLGVFQSFDRIASTVSLNSRFRRNQYMSAAPAIPAIPPASPRRKTEKRVEGNVRGPTANKTLYAAIPPVHAATLLSKNVRRIPAKNPPKRNSKCSAKALALSTATVVYASASASTNVPLTSSTRNIASMKRITSGC